MVTIFASLMLGTGAMSYEGNVIGNGSEIDCDLPIQYSIDGMITDQVIIKFDSYDHVRTAQSTNLLPGVAFQEAMTLRPMALYTITNGSTVFDTITSLRGYPNVQEVYPNYKRSLAAIPNDPYYQLQQEELLVAQIPSAWDIETGSSSVLVGVIDTGVDITHPDLLPNLVLPGINVRETSVPDVVIDDSGHGTAVAGVIGGVGNNGIGVAGVCWNVSILPIRACGGPLLECDIYHEIAGIDAAREAGCDVINLSIGGVGTITDEEDAVALAAQAGIVIVAAAGNGNPGHLFKKTDDPEADRHSLYYPAALPAVIGVGAVGNNSQKTVFSNFGEDILSIMAPGVDIVTTVPEDEVYLYTGDGPPYGLATGTSFATPLVAGVAALIISKYPGISAEDVRNRLECTAIPMPGPDENLNGINDRYGYGVLNAYGALTSDCSGITNNFLNVGVTQNPVFPGELLILIQALVPLDTPPQIGWADTTDAGIGGTFNAESVPTRSGFYIGRIHDSGSGSYNIVITATSNGAPVTPVTIKYSVPGS